MTPSPDRKPRIAAVVVTYNRCAQLEGCLGALMQQDYPLDAILVIDNASTDNTPETLKQKYGGKITHVRLEENLGGSAGFHEGIRLAYEKGYDWIWAMDDDVEPATDALQALVESPAFTDPAVGLLAPLVLDAKPRNQTPRYVHFNSIMTSCPDSSSWIPVATGYCRRYNLTLGYRPAVRNHESLESPLIPIEGAGFPSVMIRRDAVSAVGLPLKELFIFWDDVEFTYRISRQFKMFLVPSSHIIHWHGWDSRSARKFLGFAKRGAGIPFAQVWKLYYYVRNEIYFRTKYAKPWLAPFVPLLVSGRCAAVALFFHDHPFARCKVLWQATVDGVLGRLGKRVSP